MTEPSASRRDRLEYLLFRVARGLLTLLPERMALGVGSALGWFAGSVLRIRRDVVARNLARAFPERSSRWRRRVAVASYRHLGREAVATFRLADESREDVVTRTEIEGLERLREVLRDGRGAILLTGHLGNWEVGGAAVAARGVRVHGVAFRQRNRLFDRDLVENRARLGMEIVRVGEAPRKLLAALRAGEVAGMVADQNARRGGVFVDFFDVPAATARGAAVLSLRTGAPIFVGAALARPGPPHRYEARIEEVSFEPTGDLDEDVRRLTAAHTALLERWVREAPEQYFWQHKRWKTRPPEERDRR